MDSKMENFLKEYNTFRRYAEQQQTSENEATTLQLFAIFRKDERSNEINGKRADADQPATERQKAYIKSIYARNGVQFTEESVNKLTKREASKVINSFKGRAG